MLSCSQRRIFSDFSTSPREELRMFRKAVGWHLLKGISCSIVCKEELRFQYCISWPPHYSGDLFILCLSTEQVSFKKGTEQGRNLKA